jgi:hypothetical protein
MDLIWPEEKSRRPSTSEQMPVVIAAAPRVKRHAVHKRKVAGAQLLI